MPSSLKSVGVFAWTIPLVSLGATLWNFNGHLLLISVSCLSLDASTGAMPLVTLRCLHGVRIIKGKHNPQFTDCGVCVVAMQQNSDLWKVIYVVKEHAGHRVRYGDDEPGPVASTSKLPPARSDKKNQQSQQEAAKIQTQQRKSNSKQIEQQQQRQLGSVAPSSQPTAEAQAKSITKKQAKAERRKSKANDSIQADKRRKRKGVEPASSTVRSQPAPSESTNSPSQSRKRKNPSEKKESAAATKRQRTYKSSNPPASSTSADPNAPIGLDELDHDESTSSGEEVRPVAQPPEDYRLKSQHNHHKPNQPSKEVRASAPSIEKGGNEQPSQSTKKRAPPQRVDRGSNSPPPSTNAARTFPSASILQKDSVRRTTSFASYADAISHSVPRPQGVHKTLNDGLRSDNTPVTAASEPASRPASNTFDKEPVAREPTAATSAPGPATTGVPAPSSCQGSPASAGYRTSQGGKIKPIPRCRPHRGDEQGPRISNPAASTVPSYNRNSISSQNHSTQYTRGVVHTPQAHPKPLSYSSLISHHPQPIVAGSTLGMPMPTSKPTDYFPPSLDAARDFRGRGRYSGSRRGRRHAPSMSRDRPQPSPRATAPATVPNEPRAR